MIPPFKKGEQISNSPKRMNNVMIIFLYMQKIPFLCFIQKELCHF
ncbi:hypothetical protein BSI_03000 [Bacillus inaquosorum KCTC 13429]|uniref:Uncharacterized protein n=1 Tax=Bacillus inaquosorum KCTC 13429 TaxID=1236548 RepID=A0A9W5LLF5_9BACI|nr:hypothetical protein BSI_03000 [Bacillus inaquosorum KCTC 13429]